MTQSHIRATLDRAGFKLNKRKYEFFKKELEFLRHIVGHQGIRINPESKKCVESIKRPYNVEELRGFQGFCSYLQMFIRNYALTASTLYELTEKHTPFDWSTQHEEAFYSLKQQLLSLPTLKFPARNERLHLFTGVSNKAVRAYLMQCCNTE
ncbi:Retrovirus-related Pol polyprotein [Thelohanellus kitauei]|uniref:Retrovirus-related Pol polyprotein n=1 Tax=Thelohanellus kitauei TaxID=669202 RepID=A0A0C2IL47_THEKT|nr:Retrovirus-related Pol polyprotein [Thelohanellus kitauei]